MTSKMKCTHGKWAHVAACTNKTFGDKASYVCEMLGQMILERRMTKRQAVLELEGLKASLRAPPV